MSAARKRDEGRRAEVERDLAEKYHVNFDYLPEVDTDEFDIDRGLSNQARFQALNEETVKIYQEAVERGDRFPAVIAQRQGRGARPKLVSIDGNHRIVAHHRAGKALDVYEVDRATKAPVVALMTYAFNTRHGQPTTEEERVAQAMYLIDNGSSHQAAAAAVNVPLRLVTRAAQRAKADLRAQEVGVDLREWDAFPADMKRKLLTISTDEGFAGAVHLAQVARLGSEETNELVSLLNTSKSGTKQRALVKAETERYNERIQDSSVLGTTTRKITTPRTRVSMVLGQVMALPDDLAALARSYAENERHEAAVRIADAAQRLFKLASTLDPSIK